jgi:hypothetical protein
MSPKSSICMHVLTISRTPKPNQNANPYAPLNRSIRTDVLDAKDNACTEKTTILTVRIVQSSASRKGVAVVLRRVVRVRYFSLRASYLITASLLARFISKKQKRRRQHHQAWRLPWRGSFARLRSGVWVCQSSGPGHPPGCRLVPLEQQG